MIPSTLPGTQSNVPVFPSALRSPKTVFWAVVAVLAVLGVFVLPFAFPPQTFMRSSSYAVGFNNRVAVIVVAGLSITVTALLVWKNAGRRLVVSEQAADMPLRWLAMACLAAVAYTAVLGGLAAHANRYYLDVGYWQDQIGHWADGHAKLYRDFEFVYGPILFYWPAYIEKAVAHLGLSPMAGFMVALSIMQVLGLAIVFYLLQQLPLLRTIKGGAFAALTFGTLTPLLGLNYTMFRFAVAFASIVWIAKQHNLWVQAILTAIAQLFMLAISPDIGVSFAVGAMACSLYRGFVAERRWLSLLVIPPIAFGLFAALIDKGYFYTVTNVSKGLFNDIIQPLPLVDIFLILAVGMCPFAVAGYVRRQSSTAAPIVGIYGASLAMVSSALGRCDEVHIFFSFIGLALLSLIGLDFHRSRWARIWVCLLLLVPITSQVILLQYNLPLIRSVAGGPTTGGFDLARLDTLTAGEKIYLPIIAPKFVADSLLANGQVQPSYFSYCTDAETLPGMQRKLEEMHQAKYVLVRMGSLKWMMERFRNNAYLRVFRLGYRYPLRHPYFDPGSIILDDVNRNYTPIEVFGAPGSDQYMLYRRK